MHRLLRSPNRLTALGLGVAFASYGILSAVTGRISLGVLFVAAGAILVAGALLGITPARRANLGAGMTWLVLGYTGLFLIGSPANLLALAPFDEVVLFAAATVHLAVALGARRDVVPLR